MPKASDWQVKFLCQAQTANLRNLRISVGMVSERRGVLPLSL
jgi:hypothetical protein